MESSTPIQDVRIAAENIVNTKCKIDLINVIKMDGTNLPGAATNCLMIGLLISLLEFGRTQPQARKGLFSTYLVHLLEVTRLTGE